MGVQTIICHRKELPEAHQHSIHESVQREFGHLTFQFAWPAIKWYGVALNADDLIGSLGILER